MVWILTFMAIVGAVCVASGEPKWAYLGHWVWLVTNVGFLMHNVRRCDWAQATLFGVYLCLTVWGVWNWGR